MNLQTTHTCTLCGYYNMKHKNRMWNHRENPKSPEEEITLGIDATGHSARIRARSSQMFG